MIDAGRVEPFHPVSTDQTRLRIVTPDQPPLRIRAASDPDSYVRMKPPIINSTISELLTETFSGDTAAKV